MENPTKTYPIGVALIGAGMIAETHVAALSAARELVRLDAIVSRRPERAHHLATVYEGPTPAFTSDIDAVAADPSIGIAIVATPPSVRAEIIKTLADAGKHVLLEKPVGRTCQEAKEVVEICEAAAVKLGVLFQHRARATSKAARKYVESGALGPLGYVEISVPNWRDQSYYDEKGRGTYERDGGGVLLTQAIHTIDLALGLTGPVESVQAMTATTPLHNMESEDLAVAGLRFTSGAVGSLVASTASFPQGPETVTLHFAHASLRIRKDSLDVNWRNGNSEPPVHFNATEVPAIRGKHEWHQGIIEDFAQAVRDDRPPLVTGREALVAHRLIEAIERSSKEQKLVSVIS